MNDQLQHRLTRLASDLIDQHKAKVLVPAYHNSTGYWFGGGNMIQLSNGNRYLVGRYRNFGDSRTGVAVGTRGLELAIFESTDQGETFEKIVSLAKADLSVDDREVLSIEGAALYETEQGIELFVSTEKKNIPYPSGFEDYLKPGTGVWTIDRLQADSIAGLADTTVTPLLESDNPNWLHIKDPFVHDLPNGDVVLGFCSHPYNWSSSNTGYTIRHKGADPFGTPVYDGFPRGFSWDVAMTRGTAIIDVPPVGLFQDQRVSLLFYDGGECVRNLDEHKQAVSRPRGYSCEELGGVAYIENGDLSNIRRLSLYEPMFVSPYGSGCSRYVDVLKTETGWTATWQQSQADLSQPLVTHSLTYDAIAAILE